MIITRLGNHHGIVLVVREDDNRMVSFDIEELLMSHFYCGGVEAAVRQELEVTREEDWQTAWELFGFLENG